MLTQEGLAAPVPLYGACVKTLELITIEPPTVTESTDASTTTPDPDATTAATLGGQQTAESAAPGIVPAAAKASSSIPAPRRRGFRVRRRQRREGWARGVDVLRRCVRHAVARERSKQTREASTTREASCCVEGGFSWGL